MKDERARESRLQFATREIAGLAVLSEFAIPFLELATPEPHHPLFDITRL